MRHAMGVEAARAPDEACSAGPSSCRPAHPDREALHFQTGIVQYVHLMRAMSQADAFLPRPRR